MKLIHVIVVAMLLVATEAQAQVSQAGPMTVPGTCVVEATNTATTIASLCGITDTTVGMANFKVVNLSTTQEVCLGGASITTSTAAGVGSAALNKCYSICDASTCAAGKSESVRGNIHKWYLRSSVNQRVFIIFGSTP